MVDDDDVAGDAQFRRVLRPQGPPSRKLERADVDLRIERPDLGRGTYTVIRKGEAIPAKLADYPRAPLDAAQADDGVDES